MSDDIYCLIIFIVLWGIFRVVDTQRIDNLNDRIKKLEEQVKEYAPIPYKEQKETEK